MAISFKGAHFPKDVILFAVFFYLRYGVSYRDLEEIMAERGITIDHAALNRWVIRYAVLVTEMARLRKGHTDRSWRKGCSNKVLRPGARGQWFAAQDRHRQERREYHRYYCHQQNVEAVWLPDSD